MGLRPSVFLQMGGLFGITRPGKTVDFQQRKDANGVPMVNADGSPTLLQQDNFRKDANGNQLYSGVDPTTGAAAATPCRVGFGASPTACVGTSVNPIINDFVSPFYEPFLGDSARPRLSIGFGVNWNSPFGPLRIDVAKALLHEKGDDTKLVTFNVGTQF
jgi:outer membrane protein insertion porin family